MEHKLRQVCVFPRGFLAHVKCMHTGKNVIYLMIKCDIVNYNIY